MKAIVSIASLLSSTMIAAAPLAAAELLPYQSPEAIVNPQIFGEGVISTQDDEFGGQFSLDGKTLWFSKSVPRFHLDTIFVSTYRDGRWSPPRSRRFPEAGTTTTRRCRPMENACFSFPIGRTRTARRILITTSGTSTRPTAAGVRRKISAPRSTVTGVRICGYRE